MFTLANSGFYIVGKVLVFFNCMGVAQNLIGNCANTLDCYFCIKLPALNRNE